MPFTICGRTGENSYKLQPYDFVFHQSFCQCESLRQALQRSSNFLRRQSKGSSGLLVYQTHVMLTRGWQRIMAVLTALGRAFAAHPHHSVYPITQFAAENCVSDGLKNLMFDAWRGSRRLDTRGMTLNRNVENTTKEPAFIGNSVPSRAPNVSVGCQRAAQTVLGCVFDSVGLRKKAATIRRYVATIVARIARRE
jgi:hypothetical protein